jgi:glycosyltransferase involved in cell wall biosynthesis
VNKISLTIDTRAIRNSGIGVYLQELLPYVLGSNRFHVSLLGAREVLEEILHKDELDRFDVIECNADIYSIKEQVEIPCKLPRCDIFWSPHYNIPILPVRANKRIVTIHDVYHLAYFKALNIVEKAYAGIVLPLAAHLSDEIITVSAFSKNEIVKYTRVRSEKIEVIHNGVDLRSFREAKADSAPLMRYQLENYILYVGNIKPHKNVTGLIKAFNIFHKSVPDVKLVIVGQKDKFINGINGLDESIRGLGLDEHVVFTGYVSPEDLHSLYKGAHLFVFPSFYEGFGLPPIEAMAAGIPVVASRAASIPEICGEAVIYVDPHNSEDIARGMLTACQDNELRNALVLKGLDRARAFPWKSSADKHIELFERVMG